MNLNVTHRKVHQENGERVYFIENNFLDLLDQKRYSPICFFYVSLYLIFTYYNTLQIIILTVISYYLHLKILSFYSE
jgi:hypothetical protein